MNYAELSLLVSSMTARPDLVSELRVAIGSAIRKFHSADTFQADLAIVEINLANYPTDSFSWSLDTKSQVFTRFRKLYHAATLPRLSTFQSGSMPSMRDDYSASPVEIPIVSPADLLDHDGYPRKNFIYLAGSSLFLRLTDARSVVQLQYFQLPNIVATGSALTIDSWIVDQMPEAVATEAAGTIFKMIGKDDEYQRHQIMFAENLAMLRQSAVLPN